KVPAVSRIGLYCTAGQQAMRDCARGRAAVNVRGGPGHSPSETQAASQSGAAAPGVETGAVWRGQRR
ncbi:MAG TPA: hypothetical protein VGQ83_36705, partial [Polyangia bacterium]